MKKYLLFQSPDGETFKVKDGFSWPAFFFGPFWGIYAKVWTQWAVMVVIYLALIFIDDYLVQPSGNVFLIIFMGFSYIFYMLAWGLKGNQWVAWNWRNRGFTQKSSANDEV